MGNDCWRCEQDVGQGQLVRDPMVSGWDAIGICRPCAVERFAVFKRYTEAGTDLVPVQIEGDVVTK